MAKAKKETVEVAVSAKVRAIAGALMQSALLLVELAGDYFGEVRAAIVGGCTFEEIESAEPDLKQVGAYRTAKSAIKRAKENGISLTNADGTAKGRTALEKETKAAIKAKAGTGEGDKVTNSTDGAQMTVHYTDVMSMMADAVKMLKADATIRAAFSLEIEEIARLNAKDLAEKAPQKKAA